MKKKLVIVLCLVLSLSMILCSCGGNTDKSDDSKTKTTTVPSRSVQGEAHSTPTTTTDDASDADVTEDSTADQKDTTTEAKIPTTEAEIPTTEVETPTTTEAEIPATTEKPTTSTTKAPTTTKKPTTSTTKAPTTTQAVKNEFNKAWSRDYIDVDHWTIYLGHAHWEGNDLVIAFYITNGFAYDITLNTSKIVEIKDSKGNVIARDQLNFNNYVVKFEEYNTVTITLSGSAILKPGANLNDDGLDIWM